MVKSNNLFIFNFDVMKKFIIQILLFSVAFFVLEKIFYVFLYVSPDLEKDKRLENVINGNMNKNLIVLGSSRGARNIIANQIEDSLSISSYNLSYPGSNIEFHEFLLRALIKHNKNPEIILLAVDDPEELLPSKSIKFRLDRLYPLAKYDYINNEMIRRGEKTVLSKFLILARINRKNFDLRERNLSALDTLRCNGSMPISFQRKDRDFIYNDSRNNYDLDKELSVKVDAFKDLQELCVSNNIKLFIVFPPNFEDHNISFANRLNELSHPTTSFILYDTTDLTYQNRNYFYDEGHLKVNGARKFTNEIIGRLGKEDSIISSIK